MKWKIREPKTQSEIDRNILILCWLMILPSISLFFVFNQVILTFLFIGGLSRLWVAALRLPNGERGFYFHMLTCLVTLTAVLAYLKTESSGGLLYLVLFWGFIIYADYRFLRYNRTQRSDPSEW